MKSQIKHFLPILSLILLSAQAFGQNSSLSERNSFTDNFERHATYSSPEKIYLHTDKDIYSTGETIWLKGYLQNASLLSELPESRFIYVELFSPDSLVSRIKLKHTDSLGFQGYIELPYSIPSGHYTLRGYSRWMTTFPSEFMFHKQLHIISGKDKESALPLPNSKQSQLAELNFYPESGRYLADIPSTIAFKANDKLGRGVNITGQLFEDNGILIMDIASSHLGMGVIQFTPQQGKKYYALVKDSNGTELKKSLPNPIASAAVINITRSQDNVSLYIHLSRDLISKNLMLIMFNKNQLFYNSELNQPLTRKMVAENELMEGINHVSVVDKAGNIYAERMFFVYPQFETIAELHTEKTEHGKREKVEVELQLQDEHKLPIEGIFSMAVTDFFTVPRVEYVETLPSYMLLSSELNGSIEESGFYFSNKVDKKQREKAVDLLMMIQGWHYYDMPKLLAGANSIPATSKEYDQQISGKIVTVNSIFKNNSNTTVSIVAPSISLYLSEKLNGNSLFLIDELDFTDSTQFMLAATSKKDGVTNMNVVMDNDVFPKQSKTLIIPSREAANARELGKTMEEYRHLAEYLYESFGKEDYYTMEEARIFGKYIYQPKHNPSSHNQAFRRMQFRERKDLEPFDEQMLSTYFATRYHTMLIPFDEDRAINNLSQGSSDGGGIPFRSVYPAKVFINFAEVEQVDSYMMVRDVETIVVLKPGDPQTQMYGMNTFGGVVLITTRQTYKSEKANDAEVTFYTPLGWQKPVAFYSPNYELNKNYQNMPVDLRTTLLWEPMLITDENGKAKVTFFTADRTTRYRFVIEGIDNNGNYISTVNVLE